MGKKETKNLVVKKKAFNVEMYGLEGIEKKVGVIKLDDGSADFVTICDIGNCQNKDGSALTEQDILNIVPQLFKGIKKLED